MTNQYCRKHPQVELQGQEVRGYNFVTECSFTYDVDYCPTCFEEYEKTGKMEKTEIVPKDAFWELVNNKKDWVI